ncbi:EscR/YscR/HrcR family type III secretion system export apparatus protein [Salmonella enterica]|uniref:EscR/YscR/HrcR family type III secretion system export apparatus protein n=2 Tax=Salmonella diarizonae TaxID=59204 RepID=A0A6Y2KNA9_SALDZ|nr:type III secretion system export apparatus subunit SctR [Salmonella enterica]EBP3743352.1 EscR/YscR/HrcR family type III secretion system export apparatus protein [Salmonella enterica subsp. arizonae]EHG9035210.1 EscR/YscR/HrcR family type III secretion system export apparatus protein [Salmonella enterica subsp. diarizonae serovar 53:z10:-]EHJ0298058.1 EscR/YscR/HrcR family type III secretion system export apparatus protein [Salmonella enterica subsp. diarizonae serovar 60:k:z]EHN2141388.1 t
MKNVNDFIHQPYALIILLVCLSILPFIVVSCTSFLKIAVVFSLLRNALGIQQIPPNMAIYGLALILTFFIMAPVGMSINDNIQKEPFSISDSSLYENIDRTVIKPYLSFLKKNTKAKQIRYFSQIGNKIWPKKYQQRLNENSLFVMLPAFGITQLDEAFKIGLLLYLPFVAIDLIVSNILLALGMMMVSPTTISLPFKIMLFIIAGGWQYLIEKLVLSF